MSLRTPVKARRDTSACFTFRLSASWRETIDWVVIEEPEMGLHPKGIQAVLLLVLELLRRGYRVVVSTHSPVVLEMVWALQEFKKLGADEANVRRLFELPSVPYAKDLAGTALKKDYRVYYFDRSGHSHDISQLDPSAEHIDEAEWGGLVGFASKVNAGIAQAVNEAEAKKRRPRHQVAKGAGALASSSCLRDSW